MFPIFPVCSLSCLFYHLLLSPVPELSCTSEMCCLLLLLPPGHGSASSAVSWSSPVSLCTAPSPLCKRETLIQGILQVPLCCRNRDLKKYHDNIQNHPLWQLVKPLQFLPLLPLLCFWYFTGRTESAFLVVRSALAAQDCRALVSGPGSRAGPPCGWEHSRCPPELPPAPRGAGMALAPWQVCHCTLQMG